MRQELLQLEQQRAHQIFYKEKLPIINATPEELHRIAEINPNLFGIKYVRWGCHFKCKKCNGYRVHTGGIRSLLQISRIVNEQKYEHRKSCKHPRWEEHWSLHAAEIAHTFIEQTTEQTHTGDLNWTDISGASIGSGSFTTGRKYLIINKVLHGGDSTSAHSGLRSLHGTTIFVESQHEREYAFGSARYNILWFTVWTAIASEGIKMQHGTFNVDSQIVKSDTITMTAIEISEDLTEGTDWDFNHNTSVTGLTNSFVAFANLTVQTADHDAGDTYMVLGYARIDPASGAQSYETRLDRSGEATSTEPTISQEGEDVGFDNIIQSFGRTFDLGASDNTFKIQCRNDQSTSGDHDFSSVFVLNLEKFKDSNEIYTEADLNNTTTDWADLAQTLSMTPSQTGDVFILGSFIADLQSTALFYQSRMQVDNADQPTGQTAYTSQMVASDNTDQLPHNLVTVENLDATSHTVDIDSDVSVATNTPHAQSRQLVMFSMELAGAAAPARRRFPQKSRNSRY